MADSSLSVSAPVVSGSGSFPTSPLVVVPVVAVPCFVSPTAFIGSSEGQFGMTHQSALANATAQAQMQLQEGCTPSSDSFQSPILSFPYPTPLKQAPLLKSENDKMLSESQELTISQPKFAKSAAHLVVKATSSDGYNWRKYGQKQVKSSELSRSYFRCTNVSCFAKKKVEHRQDGQVTEIIYRGRHTHGPPLLRTKSSRERGSQPSGCGFLGGNEYMEIPKIDVSVSKYCTDNKKEKGSQSDADKVHSSSDSDGDPNTSVEYSSCEQGVKRRHCDNTVASPRSSKSVKETKTVVRRASDSELANDGYRWRKYGQKIVKGCLSPRSYYKCTTTGCPVRKHVEKASEDANSVIITYEGKHNHDLIPSKSGNEVLMTAATSHLAPAATLLMAAEIATDKETPTKSTPEENKLAPEKASELGEDMALESAKTLLSIRCNPTSRKNSKLDDPRAIPHPLFDGNHSAVQVQNS